MMRQNAIVIIDNSGSSSMYSGIIKDGHELTVLDRHVVAATAYLSMFPLDTKVRIVQTERMWDSEEGKYTDHLYEDFDNTEDAIDHLLTLDSGGPGFYLSPAFDADSANKMARGYNNVLIVMDEPLRFTPTKPKTLPRLTV